MIAGIDHIHVYTKNLDESIAFYTDILGGRFFRKTEFGPSDHRGQLAYVGFGDLLLEFLPVQQNEIPEGGNRPLCLKIVGMDETLADLEKKGVEIVRTWEGFSFSGRAGSIKDPSGLSIELREWRLPDSPHFMEWTPTREDVVRLG